jgi:GNAT superfamily N-acetyltransferase
MMLASWPPTTSEMECILHRANYNVLDGSWSHTRSIYVKDVLVGFYVLANEYLYFLHIFKQYRRRGFGQKAVGFMTLAIPNLYLHATPSARAFWERCGFRTKDSSDRGCVEMRLT